MISTLSKTLESNRYLGNKWMTICVWQLSQDKTIWQYNIKPTTDKTSMSQHGIRCGMHKEPTKGVCEGVPKGPTLVLPTTAKSMRCYQWHVPDRYQYHWHHQLMLKVSEGSDAETKELLPQRKQCCSTGIINSSRRKWGKLPETRTRTYDSNQDPHRSNQSTRTLNTGNFLQV